MTASEDRRDDRRREHARSEFAALLANREFRAMWLAIGQSQFGDQLGRVALSVLVFSRTGSGLATAAVYALTYFPAVVGGVLLSGLADRHPRRALLVTCDLLRAVLFAFMAVPAVPVWGVAVLLTAAVVVGAPHKAAEPAIVADMFDGQRYTAALGVRSATAGTAQLLGFAVGGVLVAAIGARTALAIDAASFAFSAALLRVFLLPRPAGSTSAERGLAAIRTGMHTVFSHPALRALLALSWLAGLWVVPEGLAAPYAAAHGGGPVSVGILLAADPVGMLVGSLVFSRWVPAGARAGALGPLALLTGAPLVACGFDPAIPTAWALWALCGLLSSYQVLLVAEFVELVPSARRGQAIGIAASGLIAVQGIGVALGGLVAAWTGPAPAIAVAGAAGALLAVVTTQSWVRARQPYRRTVRSAQI